MNKLVLPLLRRPLAMPSRQSGLAPLYQRFGLNTTIIPRRTFSSSTPATSEPIPQQKAQMTEKERVDFMANIEKKAKIARANSDLMAQKIQSSLEKGNPKKAYQTLISSDKDDILIPGQIRYDTLIAAISQEVAATPDQKDAILIKYIRPEALRCGRFEKQVRVDPTISIERRVDVMNSMHVMRKIMEEMNPSLAAGKRQEDMELYARIEEAVEQFDIVFDFAQKATLGGAACISSPPHADFFKMFFQKWNVVQQLVKVKIDAMTNLGFVSQESVDRLQRIFFDFMFSKKLPAPHHLPEEIVADIRSNFWDYSTLEIALIIDALCPSPMAPSAAASPVNPE